jgi:hypothetical protein
VSEANLIERVRIEKAHVGNDEFSVEQAIDDLRVDHAGLSNLIGTHNIKVFEVLLEDRLDYLVEQPISMTARGASVGADRPDNETCSPALSGHVIPPCALPGKIFLLTSHGLPNSIFWEDLASEISSKPLI